MFRLCGKILSRTAIAAAAVASIPVIHRPALAEATCINKNHEKFEEIAIMPGSSGKVLAGQIASIIGCKNLDVKTRRFSDGETLVIINDTVRGRHVFIVQTCAAPMSDNIVELLQMVSAARGSGADRVTAIIPYFPYKFPRRGLPLVSSSQSRFLWSAAFDFAKMLKVMGVDCVVSVDLQRPGQGHEACFFDNTIPVESVYSGNVMAKYFIDNVKLQNYKDTGSPRLAVVSANTKCVKKTRRFQKYFSEELKTPVGFAVFLQTSKQDSEEGIDMVKSDVTTEILGDVLDADVVIVDEQVDTGATLAALCHKLKKEGARRIFICASHGLFSGNSMEMIDLSPVEQVIVTDSVPLSAKASDKIVQIPLAPMLAKIVEANVIHMDTAKQDRREEVFGSLLDESEDFTLE